MTDRCAWALKDPLLMSYHDQEWGVPEFNSQRLFELMTLEIFQAGLSWLTVLKKRQALQLAFAEFDCQVVSQYGQTELDLLMNNVAIIRNKAKITATIANAKCLKTLAAQQIDLATLLWEPTNRKPLNHFRTNGANLPTTTFIQPYVSQFKRFGFKRLGPTTLFSWLQAAGVVNDHEIKCFRYRSLMELDSNSF